MKQQTKINFDPIQHRYTDDNGTVYTSVTTLIGKYQPTFDKRYWSMYVVLRDCGFNVKPTKVGSIITVDGVPRTLDYLYKNPVNVYEVKQVVNKWKDITQIACDRGNEIHDFLEDNINESKDDPTGETNKLIKPSLQLQGELLVIKTKHDLDKTAVKDRYPIIYQRLLAYINLGCILFAEKKVFNTYYQVAGMIDVLVVHVKTKQFAIVDWKTNKDVLMFESGYFKKEYIGGEWKKTNNFISKKSYLHSPLDTVENCKGMVYTLQLSSYAVMMILWGYKLVPNGLEIFHIRPNEEPRLIKVPFLEKEIYSMLHHHYTKRVITNSPNNTLFGIT